MSWQSSMRELKEKKQGLFQFPYTVKHYSPSHSPPPSLPLEAYALTTTIAADHHLGREGEARVKYVTEKEGKVTEREGTMYYEREHFYNSEFSQFSPCAVQRKGNDTVYQINKSTHLRINFKL